MQVEGASSAWESRQEASVLGLWEVTRDFHSPNTSSSATRHLTLSRHSPRTSYPLVSIAESDVVQLDVFPVTARAANCRARNKP